MTGGDNTEFTVYEMVYRGETGESHISCIPFRAEYWEEYMEMYNSCFHELREALGICPADFYSRYSQMKDRGGETFLYLKNGSIAGAVSFYGNELDDLIVRRDIQGQGIGKNLLLWGIKHIYDMGYEQVILHAAGQNSRAVGMYLKAGFIISRWEEISR